MRRALPAVSAAALIGGSTALAFFTGGYLERPRVIAAIVAWVLVALAALSAPRPLPLSTPGRLALGGLFGLCVWTALSMGWAPVGDRAEEDLQRLMLYLGAFVAALAFLRGPGVKRALEPALALGVLAVALYGLSERLLPGLIELDRSFTSSGRLEQPLTYWNAMGILAVVGLLLAIRLAGDPGRRSALRALAAAGGVPLGLAVYLSFARGALAALAVGLLVLVALAPAARAQLRGIGAVLGPATLAALVGNALPSVKEVPEGRGDTGEGLVMLAALVVLSLAAAAIVRRRPRRQLPAPRLRASRPKTVLTAAAVVLVVGGLMVAVFEGKPENTSPVRGADPARFASIDTNRYRYWEVAVRELAEHPVRGLGSGGFAVAWLSERDRVDRAGDAHSLYLETSAELGLVGLGFLLVFMGGVAAAAVRLYRLDAGAVTGLAAGLAAWAFHAGLDWDWEMPAVTLPVLLLAAGVVAWSEETESRSAGAARVEAGGREVDTHVSGVGAVYPFSRPPAEAEAPGPRH